MIVNPKYTHLQKQIEEIPKFFADEGKVVYDGRNILKRISLDNVDVVVKSFKKPHIINRVVYSYFRNPKLPAPISIPWNFRSMVSILRNRLP